MKILESDHMHEKKKNFYFLKEEIHFIFWILFQNFREKNGIF
jgi:hypothetical protein